MFIWIRFGKVQFLSKILSLMVKEIWNCDRRANEPTNSNTIKQIRINFKCFMNFIQFERPSCIMTPSWKRTFSRHGLTNIMTFSEKNCMKIEPLFITTKSLWPIVFKHGSKQSKKTKSNTCMNKLRLSMRSNALACRTFPFGKM